MTPHGGLDLGKWKMGLAGTVRLLDGRTVTAALVVRVRPGKWSEEAAVNAIARGLAELESSGVPLDGMELHVEQPQHYGGKGKAALQKDVKLLEDLAERVRREFRPLGIKVVLYRPGKWKGNVPKPVHHRRLRRVLSEKEVRAIEARDYGDAQADVWDAVGLALFGAGRVGRAGRRI